MAVFLPHKKILPSAFSFNKKIPINKCEFENSIKDTIFKIGNELSPHQVAGIISPIKWNKSNQEFGNVFRSKGF
jgi:hypothetical protein